ncbi:hypothetical protein Agub_g1178 [Astrephomene gubernaculifera]|uniref:Protein kinase domain-containing protein n=1 Tax=Astrephomene gubernaculifera TaxID=47775 RepID=A0AAD3DH61_9CHLO|nr:hypothetical protein Agub_g1178 [Astrephomene gubernaculifera]
MPRGGFCEGSLSALLVVVLALASLIAEGLVIPSDGGITVEQLLAGQDVLPQGVIYLQQQGTDFMTVELPSPTVVLEGRGGTMPESQIGLKPPSAYRYNPPAPPSPPKPPFPPTPPQSQSQPPSPDATFQPAEASYTVLDFNSYHFASLSHIPAIRVASGQHLTLSSLGISATYVQDPLGPRIGTTLSSMSIEVIIQVLDGAILTLKNVTLLMTEDGLTSYLIGMSMATSSWTYTTTATVHNGVIQIESLTTQARLVTFHSEDYSFDAYTGGEVQWSGVTITCPGNEIRYPRMAAAPVTSIWQLDQSSLESVIGKMTDGTLFLSVAADLVLPGEGRWQPVSLPAFVLVVLLGNPVRTTTFDLAGVERAWYKISAEVDLTIDETMLQVIQLHDLTVVNLPLATTPANTSSLLAVSLQSFGFDRMTPDSSSPQLSLKRSTIVVPDQEVAFLERLSRTNRTSPAQMASLFNVFDVQQPSHNALEGQLLVNQLRMGTQVSLVNCTLLSASRYSALPGARPLLPQSLLWAPELLHGDAETAAQWGPLGLTLAPSFQYALSNLDSTCGPLPGKTPVTVITRRDDQSVPAVLSGAEEAASSIRISSGGLLAPAGECVVGGYPQQLGGGRTFVNLQGAIGRVNLQRPVTLRNLVFYNLAPGGMYPQDASAGDDDYISGHGMRAEPPQLRGPDAAWANSSLPLWFFSKTGNISTTDPQAPRLALENVTLVVSEPEWRALAAAVLLQHVGAAAGRSRRAQEEQEATQPTYWRATAVMAGKDDALTAVALGSSTEPTARETTGVHVAKASHRVSRKLKGLLGGSGGVLRWYYPTPPSPQLSQTPTLPPPSQTPPPLYEQPLVPTVDQPPAVIATPDSVAQPPPPPPSLPPPPPLPPLPLPPPSPPLPTPSPLPPQLPYKLPSPPSQSPSPPPQPRPPRPSPPKPPVPQPPHPRPPRPPPSPPPTPPPPPLPPGSDTPVTALLAFAAASQALSYDYNAGVLVLAAAQHYGWVGTNVTVTYKLPPDAPRNASLLSYPSFTLPYQELAEMDINISVSTFLPPPPSPPTAPANVQHPPPLVTRPTPLMLSTDTMPAQPGPLPSSTASTAPPPPSTVDRPAYVVPVASSLSAFFGLLLLLLTLMLVKTAVMRRRYAAANEAMLVPAGKDGADEISTRRPVNRLSRDVTQFAVANVTQLAAADVGFRGNATGASDSSQGSRDATLNASVANTTESSGKLESNSSSPEGTGPAGKRDTREANRLMRLNNVLAASMGAAAELRNQGEQAKGHVGQSSPGNTCSGNDTQGCAVGHDGQTNPGDTRSNGMEARGCAVEGAESCQAQHVGMSNSYIRSMQAYYNSLCKQAELNTRTANAVGTRDVEAAEARLQPDSPASQSSRLPAADIPGTMRAAIDAARAELQDYALELHSVIAIGASGVVYGGTWRDLPAAIKTLVVPATVISLVGRARHRAVLEAAVSMSLAHPNIVATYTYDIKALVQKPEPNEMSAPVGIAAAGDAEQGAAEVYKLYIVQEYCNAGTLREALEKGMTGCVRAGGAFKALALRLALDVAQGMRHIHCCRIVHGDLKPENVLLVYGPQSMSEDEGANRDEPYSEGLMAKVADFGLSLPLPEGATHASGLFRGTPAYMAPEVSTGGQLSPRADVWSFGLLLLELYYGCSMSAVLASELPAAGHGGEGVPTREPLLQLPHLLKDMLTSAHRPYGELAAACLTLDPRSRPSFNDIVEQLRQLL